MIRKIKNNHQVTKDSEINEIIIINHLENDVLCCSDKID